MEEKNRATTGELLDEIVRLRTEEKDAEISLLTTERDRLRKELEYRMRQEADTSAELENCREEHARLEEECREALAALDATPSETLMEAVRGALRVQDKLWEEADAALNAVCTIGEAVSSDGTVQDTIDKVYAMKASRIDLKDTLDEIAKVLGSNRTLQGTLDAAERVVRDCSNLEVSLYKMTKARDALRVNVRSLEAKLGCVARNEDSREEELRATMAERNKLCGERDGLLTEIALLRARLDDLAKVYDTDTYWATADAAKACKVERDALSEECVKLKNQLNAINTRGLMEDKLLQELRYEFGGCCFSSTVENAIACKRGFEGAVKELASQAKTLGGSERDELMKEATTLGVALDNTRAWLRDASVTLETASHKLNTAHSNLDGAQQRIRDLKDTLLDKK